MNDVSDLLDQLGTAARGEEAPQIDVRADVLKTVAGRPVKMPFERLPIVFAAAAVGVAAAVALTFLPTWQLLSEPWVCYFP